MRSFAAAAATRMRMAAALLVLTAAVLARAQERPLPDVRTFLENARENLRRDWQLDENYTYTERRTDYSGDPSRQVVRVYQVVPGTGGRGYRRLVEENGRKRTPEEIAVQDAEHDKRVSERQHQLATESSSDRERRLLREAKRRADEQQMWDDVARVYAFTVNGRDRVNGLPVIVVDFKPKPDAQPLTDNGRRMMKARGRAWVSEDDYQVARIDAEVLDDISVGWGLIGKLYSGATASYVRTKTNGSPWLPQQLSYAGNGRALIKRFAVKTVIDYYDFKKVENGKQPEDPIQD